MDGVKGCVWGVRMLELDCCREGRTAASLRLLVLCGCSHNSVQSSDLTTHLHHGLYDITDYVGVD